MFNIDAPIKIQEDVFAEEDDQHYPAIAWHGRYDGADKRGGFFTLDVAAVEGKPTGWEETEIRYGTDPNADLVAVYKTQQLTCVPLGVRKRILITDAAGNEHIYPWRTAKRNRVAGRFTSHYQVMVILPGLKEPCVLGLRGLTKTTSWDNDAKGSYRNNDFPTGVGQLLATYAAAASKANGQVLPRFCLWEITLQPYMVNGEALYLKVGRGDSIAHMNPFTAKMSVQDAAYLNARFVGETAFELFQTLRQEITVAWEKQWSREAMQEAANQINAFFTPKAALAPEPQVDEEIPF